MALEHDGVLEVACNLRRPQDAGPAAVEAQLVQLAAGEGVALGASYCIGKTPEAIMAEAAHALQLVSSS